MKISSADLIINPDGSVYHLNLKPDEIPQTIFTVGDPGRVEKISKHFDSLKFRRQHREINSHCGRIGNRDIMVISTGMGTDNVEIVLNELDALVNIDLEKSLPKPDHTSLKIIRIGTSGSLQEEVEVGSLVASRTGVGIDTLMEFYGTPWAEAPDISRMEELQAHIGLSFSPYLAPAYEPLFTLFMEEDIHEGNTLTCPGFYMPQGRHLRLPHAIEGYMEKVMSFKSGDFRLTNMEMETSALYALGKIMGHKTLSLSAIMANRKTNEFAPFPDKVMEKLIFMALNKLAEI